jgi:hypothetical protein
MQAIQSIHPTATINVWKKTNRVSRLWEELAENCVAPDPGVDWEAERSIPLTLSSVETGSSFHSQGEAKGIVESPLLERVSWQSIDLIKQALDALTAPPEETPRADPACEAGLAGQPDTFGERDISTQADPDMFPAMIRVPFEPEPHASTIETRRMAYGLRIPPRPLHKRPMVLRLYFCLRIWIRMAIGKRGS